jgi:aminopeptidase N
MIEARTMKNFLNIPLAMRLFILLWLPLTINAYEQKFDVTHYDAEVEPDIAGKSVRGKVVLRISISASPMSNSNKVGNAEIQLDCGQLTIDSVSEGKSRLQFSVADRHLKISLPQSHDTFRQITVEYHGRPRWGIFFFPEQQQVYTLYSTSQWLPCVDAPEDRATLRMRLILRPELTAVANGTVIKRGNHISTLAAPGKIVHEWVQTKPIPSYIFGFAAGPFKVIKETSGRTQLHYLAPTENRGPNEVLFTPEQLRRIFRDTRDMIEFYEDRSGVPYSDPVYTQVLAAGGVEQEMSSFTALRATYGKDVLANERDITLGAHELAHQWWGNMVTCRDWNHMWLNEGIATFMAAAYLEHRFGREEYLKQIETSRAAYEKVRAAGKDKSLVFPDWLHPTDDDRTLVYDKGAYVVHLLREELGENRFWSALRLYTRRYWMKSVTTPDFQKAMEEGGGRQLDAFFQKWVY